MWPVPGCLALIYCSLYLCYFWNIYIYLTSPRSNVNIPPCYGISRMVLLISSTLGAVFCVKSLLRLSLSISNYARFAKAALPKINRHSAENVPVPLRTREKTSVKPVWNIITILTRLSAPVFMTKHYKNCCIPLNTEIRSPCAIYSAILYMTLLTGITWVSNTLTWLSLSPCTTPGAGNEAIIRHSLSGKNCRRIYLYPYQTTF